MDLKQAADDVRKLTRFFGSLSSICTALDSMHSIEQAESDAKAKLARTRSEVDTAVGELAQKNLELQNAVSDIDEATKLAEEITSSAKKSAQEIVSKAKEDAAARMAESGEKRRVVESAIDAAKETLASLNESVKDEQAKLEKIQANVAAARAQAMAMFSGN